MFFHIYNFKIVTSYPVTINDMSLINISKLPKYNVLQKTDFNIKYKAFINNIIRQYNLKYIIVLPPENNVIYKKYQIKYLKYKTKYMQLKQSLKK